MVMNTRLGLIAAFRKASLVERHAMVRELNAVQTADDSVLLDVGGQAFPPGLYSANVYIILCFGWVCS
jgi:hypothetical protein